MDRTALEDPVEGFIAELAPELRRIAGRLDGIDPARTADDVAVEAFDLCAAFVDVDGYHSEAELWELIATFGPRLATQLGFARPEEVRRAGILAGRSRWLERPSALFEILRADDARTGGRTVWTYFDRAMAMAHAVAALEAHPSAVMLRALDAFRTMLVDAANGRPRPEPEPAGGDGARPAHESSGAPGVTPAPGIAPAPAPSGPPRTVEAILADLDRMVGLGPVKAEIKLVTNLLRIQQVRTQRHLPVPGRSQHLVFTGNPGTGKTTVARLMAEIYRALGVVSTGQLVETDRSGLVAGFVGQTAPLVTKVVAAALGGVLLIDEAYGLSRAGDAFGQEAIDTLVKLMEDHRDDLVVVVAGYPEEMAGFVASNPGLASRFPRTINFPDYTGAELLDIFGQLCADNAYRLDPEARAAAQAVFDAQPRGRGFGNGRVARNLFEAAVERQASRLVTAGSEATLTDDDLCTLLPADVQPVAADGPAPAPG
ncbi:MAG: hypothetical protein NVSMB12_13350 [Acidimicrobiales bacterium]